MSAHEVAVARAGRLRAVLDECERILSNEGDPRREAAERWLAELVRRDEYRGYPTWSPRVAMPAGSRHTPGAHLALKTQGDLEGWPDRSD